jgi:hypothetical protein
VSTVTQLSPDLVQAIRDAIPCEVETDTGADYVPCDRPASWLAWFTPQPGGGGKLTICDDHKQAAERHNTHCPACRSVGRVFHAEPLR